MIKVTASIDPSPNAKYAKKLNKANFVETIHLDVMDGKFVERKSMTIKTYKKICKVATKPVHAHLMIENPEINYKYYLNKKTSSITLQFEAFNTNPADTLNKIKISKGLAINPATPVSAIAEFLPLCDIIIIMSVVAGKSGQEFMPQVLSKVTAIKAMNKKIKVVVDGGIKNNLLKQVEDAGADYAVQGTTIYNRINEEHI